MNILRLQNDVISWSTQDLPTSNWGKCSAELVNFFNINYSDVWQVGPCQHGMAHPQVADGGTASSMEGSYEYIE
jgi:hypothetical protein